MSVIQDSFDKLLGAIRRAQHSEKISIYYVIEPKNSGRLKHTSDETILHIAAQRGHVRISIEAGSSIKVEDNCDKTFITVENKPYEFIEAIDTLCHSCGSISLCTGERGSYPELEKLDLHDYVPRLFLVIIHWECKNNTLTTAEKLISLRYPLCIAALLGNAEVVEHMILRGCPVNGHHPHRRFTALTKAVQLQDLELVKVLVKHGAAVDLADSYGMLPIGYYDPPHTDCKRQQPEIIKILLSKMIQLKNMSQADVAYQFRKVFQSANKEVVEMLLESRNDMLSVKDLGHETPLHHISKNPHSDITDALQSRKIDVNVTDLTGRTPLFTAAESPYSHINTFNFLLENGADVNARADCEGREVPLFALCQHFYEKKEKYFELIELLLHYNLDIQYVGMNQRTVFDIILQKQSFYYMAEPLLARLAILEEQGKPVKEYIRNKINSYQTFKNYFELCKSELVDMKNNNINEKLTLHMIVVDQISENQILKSCRFSSEALTKFEKLKNEFRPDNCYYTMVQKRISSIVLMLELLKKASPIVSRLLQLGNNPCHVVVTEIVSYLDTQDLQALVKVEI